MRRLINWKVFLENRKYFHQDIIGLNEELDSSEEQFLASNNKILTPEIYDKIKEVFADYKREFHMWIAKRIDEGKISNVNLDNILEDWKKHFDHFRDYGSSICFWIGKNIIDGNILPEDVFSWTGYLQTYEKNKTKPFFKSGMKEMGLSMDFTKIYGEDLEKFRHLLNNIQSQNNQYNSISDDDRYLGETQLFRLEELGVKYHGIVEGYQLFEVDSSACSWTLDQWKYYKKTLGQYSTSGQPGELLNVCTFQSINTFKNYLCEDKPGSRFWILYDKNDYFSPYQFGYEHGQFMNRKNQDVLEKVT